MAASKIADIAFERAWRVYRLMNRDESEHSRRRRELETFIRKCCEQGSEDTEAIVVLALIHLKQLDEMTAGPRKIRRAPRPGKSGTNDPTCS